MAEQNRTLELVVQELQNRIGQITSDYETKLALLKAQATQEIEARDVKIKEFTEEASKSNKKDDGK